FLSGRGRHTIAKRDWSSDVCSSDLRRSWNVNSESGRRLSLEELKQRNRASAPSVPAAPPDTPTRQDWENLLAVLTALYQLEKAKSGRASGRARGERCGGRRGGARAR